MVKERKDAEEKRKADREEEEENKEQPPIVVEEKEDEESKQLIVVNDNDVLLGRGGTIFKHKGNQKLVTLCTSNIHNYNNARKLDKPRIAKALWEELRASTDPPTRFLKRDSSNSNTDHCVWVEASEKVGLEKVAQVLRDIRRRTSSPSKSPPREPPGAGYESISSSLLYGGAGGSMNSKVLFHQMAHQGEQPNRNTNDFSSLMMSSPPLSLLHHQNQYPPSLLFHRTNRFYEGRGGGDLGCSTNNRHYPAALVNADSRGYEDYRWYMNNILTGSSLQECKNEEDWAFIAANDNSNTAFAAPAHSALPNPSLMTIDNRRHSYTPPRMPPAYNHIRMNSLPMEKVLLADPLLRKEAHLNNKRKIYGNDASSLGADGHHHEHTRINRRRSHLW